MNENTSGTGNLLDTTDCLEAVGVFRGWKNLFFIIIFLSIMLLQACFWLLDLGLIPIPQGAAEGEEIGTFKLFVEPDYMSGQTTGTPEEAAEPEKTPVEDKPAEAVEPNKPAETGGPVILAAETEILSPNDLFDTKPAEKEFLFGVTFEHVIWIMRFVNAILILTVILYCLTMLFSLKISMLGRLGGINHITRAFFLSLLMLVLVLPWQRIFGGVIMGAIFTPGEFLRWNAEKTSDMLDMVLYYMRFSGYIVLVFLLLILSQIRSSRWAKAILRRLEII
ncbi:MAG: hypothetical protein JW787_15650 [Sedimentisphaerales bacterium]|nr:hypothetical protein [Sedimentisphaerales bacterium]